MRPEQQQRPLKFDLRGNTAPSNRVGKMLADDYGVRRMTGTTTVSTTSVKPT